MTGLYIALTVIALLGLLLILPVSAVIAFAAKSGENEITVRYLFFKFKIFPTDEKKDEKDSGGKEEQQKKDKKGAVNQIWVARSELKQGLEKLLVYIMKHAVIVKELNISARFGFDNPMTTGLATGAANGLVYNVIGLLDRRARLKKWSVSLEPDFDEPCMDAGVYCRLHTRIAHIFPLAVIFLRAYLNVKNKMKTSNGGEENEQSD